MKILFAKLKKKSFAKHAQGIIIEETKNSYLIRTLGIGQIIEVEKSEIESYHIEWPTTAFSKLIY